MRLRPRHVRTRLTLWYVSVLAGVLILYAAGTSAFFFFNLRHELDRTLFREFETIENLIEIKADGLVRLDQQHHEDEAFEFEQEFLLEIWSMDGKLLYPNERMENLALGGPPEANAEKIKWFLSSKSLSDGNRIRMLSGIENIDGQPLLIRVARSEEHLWHEFGEFMGVLLIGLPLALLIAGLSGYGLARRALAPIDKMARQAQKISAEHLNERLPIENPEDELGKLAQAFNAMLERIQHSFTQLRRFTADASHELRTPLTALRSVGEVGLQNERNSDHYRSVISSMLEEVDRMTRLIDSLLLLSRADAEQIQLKKEKLALFDVAKEACVLLSVLAEEKSQHLEVEGEQNLTILADRLILRQALINLIDNAIKYSPKGGKIIVQVKRKGKEEAIVEVIDSGPGIANEHQDKVFERFYRVDKARSRDLGGVGLGLAITRWAVQAHDGRVELENTQGNGCVFRLLFPV